ncbi:MAG: hypothetical protein LBR25_07490 [Erysipelotrichaceae bacterium]|jgi:hypothetical protein|nr:hypothetical protein [Erysipelotrichaceae bacterium]
MKRIRKGFLALWALVLLAGCDVFPIPKEMMAGDIISFRYELSGHDSDCKNESYFLLKNELEDYTLTYHCGSVDDFTAYYTISTKEVEALYQLMDEYKVYTWHQFNEGGEKTDTSFSFYLYAYFSSQEWLEADGDHKYPDGFKEAHSALVIYLNSLVGEHTVNQDHLTQADFGLSALEGINSFGFIKDEGGIWFYSYDSQNPDNTFVRIEVAQTDLDELLALMNDVEAFAWTDFITTTSEGIQLDLYYDNGSWRKYFQHKIGYPEYEEVTGTLLDFFISYRQE